MKYAILCAIVAITLIVIFIVLQQKIESFDQKIQIINKLKVPINIEYISGENTINVGGIKDKYSLDVVPKKKDQFVVKIKNELFGRYAIKGTEQQLIVGDIVTKLQHMSTSYVPIKDMPELRIHNLSNMDLLFNTHIVAPSKQMTVYTGIEQSGISTGFKLCNNLYSSFTIVKPVTDIYYGIISDSELPNYSEQFLTI